MSPVARRLADENGIEVRTLTGSGPDGRIVERDVQRAIEAKAARTSEVPDEAETAPAAVTPKPGFEAFAANPSPPDSGERLPYTGRRRVIGERMHDSLASMAQLTLMSETPVEDAIKMLHGLNREWRRDGVVVTLIGLIVKACALALREHPQLNSRLDAANGAIVLVADVNVGVAVSVDVGLIVPVVRNADRLSLKELATALQDQISKTREDRLTISDVEGGTFTVTSLDSTVVDAFTPIINPPQAAILGVGRVRDVAAFEGGEVVKRQVTTLSLTFDHRVTDGAPGSRFLERVAEHVERIRLVLPGGGVRLESLSGRAEEARRERAGVARAELLVEVREEDGAAFARRAELRRSERPLRGGLHGVDCLEVRARRRGDHPPECGRVPAARVRSLRWIQPQRDRFPQAESARPLDQRASVGHRGAERRRSIEAYR